MDRSLEPPPASGPQSTPRAGRNPKWAILPGILGAAALILVLSAAFCLVIFGSIKSSEVSVTAVRRARSNAEVVRALGSPVEAGWWVSGSISTSGPSGQADLAIPLHGPHGTGTLYLRAEKVAGEWRYKLLEVGVPGREGHIKLLSAQDQSGI